MQDFYEQVVGLEPINRDGPLSFFESWGRLCWPYTSDCFVDADSKPNHGDHIFSLPTISKTTLHHIALAIDVEHHQAEKRRL
jgi:hypothetical protein